MVTLRVNEDYINRDLSLEAGAVIYVTEAQAAFLLESVPDVFTVIKEVKEPPRNKMIKSPPRSKSL